MLPDDGFIALEAFVCLLYGQPQCTDINRAQYNIFRTGLSNDRVLPPNRDSLRQHSLRANYQCAIHRLSLDAEICAPSPLNHGWTEDEGRLVFTWMTLPLAPDDIIKNVQCKCKKASCTTNRCSCHNARLNCTEMCLCQDCLNTPNNESDSDCELASSSEDEDEDDC